MRRSFFALLGSLALVAALLPGSVIARAPDASAGKFTSGGIYIVQMVDDPVVAYSGGITGYRATAPKAGQKIDPYASDVMRYAGYLKGSHAAVLAKTGGSKLYDYVYSYDGFAARMTAAQANKMAALDGVLAVSPDETHTVDTSSTPTFLGLTDKGGLWDQLGGTANAGEGIIVGVIDSGITPESLSFADRVDAKGIPSPAATSKLAFQQIPGWHGKCTPGESFVASNCNQKLIGAQWFDASWGGDKAINAAMPWEFTSARDYNGHGTHTSSTAAGDHDVPTTGPAAVFGPVSGMAPRARVAMYKALWSTQDASTASGNNSDLVAAIDQAVADGVDVINYSISGTLTNYADPVEISYLFAARAGIFVAESAGNSGPATSTVAHPAPWTTTVAAGTHNRSANGTVTFGNAATYTGASTSPAEVTAPLIDSTAAGMAGAPATAVALCFSTVANGGKAALDPAKVAGKIVVCDRGTNARVDKSLAVKEAGGVGMILVNPTNNSLNADFHSVPTVHLQNTDYAAVHAYAATPGATATISKAFMDYDTRAPFTASFSSRGPSLAGGGNLLKPDLIAPGQDILAAVAPVSSGGLQFNLYSGTSMSSPHVAGLAALLKQLHPTWSPMAIKSALMTTGYDVLDGGTPAPNTNPVLIFRQGAGHVQPNKAADPGLVFNAGWNDWLAFLCGTSSAVGASTCTALKGAGYSTDPSGYNSPSISVGSLAGTKTVTRTVTNVGKTTATYKGSVSTASGFSVSLDPASFTLAPGVSQKIDVTLTRTTATLNVYAGAQISWTDGTHTVRIPVVAKPVALAAPAQVSSAGGPIGYDVTFGYTGAFQAAPRGLVAADVRDGSVKTGNPTFNPGDPGTVSFDVVVPAGTTYARFSLFDATTTPGSDLDLYVYRGATQVGASGGGTAEEEVDLVNPTAATYTVWVHGFATSNPSTFKLFDWVLGSTDAGNMTVSAPTAAVLGQSGHIGLTFSGLAAGTKYLGSVAYGGVSGMPNPTIVRVDP